jgi:hypothetical protein
MTRKSERSRTFTIFHNNKRIIIPRTIPNDKILYGHKRKNTLKFNIIIVITKLRNFAMLTASDKQTTAPSILRDVNRLVKYRKTVPQGPPGTGFLWCCLVKYRKTVLQGPPGTGFL